MSVYYVHSSTIRSVTLQLPRHKLNLSHLRASVLSLTEDLIREMLSYFSYKEYHCFAVTCKYGLFLCQENLANNRQLAFVMRNFDIFSLFNKVFKKSFLTVFKYPFTHLPVGYRSNRWLGATEFAPSPAAPIIPEAMWFRPQQYFVDEGDSNTKILRQILKDPDFLDEHNLVASLLSDSYWVGTRDAKLYDRMVLDLKQDKYKAFLAYGVREHLQWLKVI